MIYLGSPVLHTVLESKSPVLTDNVVNQNWMEIMDESEENESLLNEFDLETSIR